jgi:4-hydroxy-tetrahydrodipicolinate reductase
VIRAGVVGATGKMGREVCRAIHEDPDVELVAAISRSAAGRPVAELMGLEGSSVITADRLEALSEAGTQVAVDFTGPSSTGEHVDWYVGHGMHAVVGTTGFEIDPAWGSQDRVGVIVAANFAIGAVLMMRFAREAARLLPDAEIVELHPPTKRDAPSGTAKATALAIEETRGGDRGPVPIHSVRLPGLVAHQEVVFGGPGQTLTIRHDTSDRSAFMPGVLLAIKAAAGRPGLTVGLADLMDLEGA